MTFRVPPPGPANPCTALVLRQGPEDILRRTLADRPPLPAPDLLRFASHHPAAAEGLIRDLRIRAACRRLAGPSANPFEAALRTAFPEGTEEGMFLDGLVFDRWREAIEPTEFPVTPMEFVAFLRILVGNTLSPIAVRGQLVEHHERLRRTPPPLSASSARIGKTPPPRPLTPETIEHYELAFRLIAQLERLSGLQLISDPTLRGQMERWMSGLPGLTNRLFLGNGARQLLVERLTRGIGKIIEGTDSFASVHAFRTHGFRRMASHEESFQAYLDKHFTQAELGRLHEYGRTPEKRQEKFYSRMASILAAKRAVLKLLGLPPERHWLEVEVRYGRPVLSGEAEKALGNRGFLMTAADDGDVGIGIAVLEPVLGASGLVGIGVDLTTRRARMIEPEQHATGEAAYKATRRAHPVGRFGSKTAREIIRQADGGAVLTGKTADAARTLRRGGHIASPLQVHAPIVKVGGAVAAVVMVPVAPHSTGRLRPLLREIAAQLGKDPADLFTRAKRNLSHLLLPNPEGLIDSARRLIARGLAIEDLQDGGDPVNRDGILLLRLIGLEWSEMETLVPGARHYYFKHSQLDPPVIQRMGSFGYDYPVSSPFLVQTESFRDAMGILPGHRVLDIMSGTGQRTAAVALFHRQAEILGIEINPDNLIQSVSFASAAGVSPANLSFAPHDVREPFPVEGFDRVLITGYSTFGFNEPMIRHLAREIKRVLRANGRLWLDFDQYERPMGFYHLRAIEKIAREEGLILHPISLLDPELNAAAYRVASK